MMNELVMSQLILLPLISVIVPVYNVEQYLDTCIKSIRNQTYKNLEIILVDDGSTDRSGDICDNHAKVDRRIKVIHQTNYGVASARNVGLKQRKGDFINFVDSDDWLEPQMYEELVRAIKQRDTIGVAMCGYYMNCDFEEKEVLNLRPVPQEILPMNKMLYYIYKRDDYKGVASYLWTKLFRKEVLKYGPDDIAIEFCESMKVGEDESWRRCFIFCGMLYENKRSNIYQ